MDYVNFIDKYHTSHKSKYIYFGAPDFKLENFKGGAGLEIEIDTDLNKEEISKKDFLNNCAKVLAFNEYRPHYFLEKDSSLKYGFELVTQPHTLPALNKFLDDIEPYFQKLIECGATDEAKRAGLHIHISKKLFGNNTEERKEALSKLLYFFATHPDNIKKIGRRRSMKKCKVLPLVTRELATEYVEKAYEPASSADRSMINRDVAINIKNNGTVEFRAMQTSLQIDVLKAELALTLHLIEKAKTISWEDANNWDKWFIDASEQVLDYLEMALSRPDIIEQAQTISDSDSALPAAE